MESAMLTLLKINKGDEINWGPLNRQENASYPIAESERFEWTRNYMAQKFVRGSKDMSRIVVAESNASHSVSRNSPRYGLQ